MLTDSERFAFRISGTFLSLPLIIHPPRAGA